MGQESALRAVRRTTPKMLPRLFGQFHKASRYRSGPTVWLRPSTPPGNATLSSSTCGPLYGRLCLQTLGGSPDRAKSNFCRVVWSGTTDHLEMIATTGNDGYMRPERL
jgi:hypothetical protein